jgi:hypothetical protein
VKAQRMTLSAFSFLLCCLLCEVEVGFNAARSQMRYSTYYSLFTRVEFFMYQVKDERPAITSSSSIIVALVFFHLDPVSSSGELFFSFLSFFLLSCCFCYVS